MYRGVYDVRTTVCACWPKLRAGRKAVAALLLFGVVMAAACTRATLLALQHEAQVASMATQLAAQHVAAVRGVERVQAPTLDASHKQATSVLDVVRDDVAGVWLAMDTTI